MSAAPSGAGRVPPAVLALSALAFMLAALPYAAGYLAARPGLLFLGALNNLGDTGQYLAALRQGMQGHVLYTNQYTSLPVKPVLMYPLYTAAGLLLGPVHLTAPAAYHLLHAVAALALLAALWRFCAFAFPGRAPLAYGIALFAGGLYLPALLVSGVVKLPFAPVALTAPELSFFTTLLISPHGTLGLAAELWALGGYAAWRCSNRPSHLIALALGGLAVGLCYPFGLPVLLATVAVDTLSYLWKPGVAGAREARVRLQPQALILPALALLPALAVALYYAVLFHRDPLWGASNMLRLPPPSLAVLVAAFGPLVALALPSVRRLMADSVGRLVVTWAAVNGLLLLAPLPQSERLLTGWSVPLSLLAAATLATWHPRKRRRWAGALALSNVTLALLYLSVALTGSNLGYYEPAGEAAAVAWLAAHSGPSDVVMASAGSGNLIVSAARCRVVVGQNFESFNWAQAQGDVLRYYTAAVPAAERLAILRRHAVTLVLAGPYERALGRFTPHAGRDYRLVYTNGAIHVFAVERT